MLCPFRKRTKIWNKDLDFTVNLSYETEEEFLGCVSDQCVMFIPDEPHSPIGMCGLSNREHKFNVCEEYLGEEDDE